ncbi:NAD(P)/FAD-dependent oxidoreductase [Gordonia jinhuaensis]|uniref:Amine oxidase domain-containing protein n=2 Tax=Gordonia jinhuaensis TaxID=1517702 RepID=A0A916T5T9_9ACTN|nr:hypothetical protein GCM10011489_21350 [Gordonia jinhuaensis]
MTDHAEIAGSATAQRVTRVGEPSQETAGPHDPPDHPVRDHPVRDHRASESTVGGPAVAMTSVGSSAQRVAVIGSGVSGLVAAHLLRDVTDVTLYEADDRLGGHAHTHQVVDPDGTELSIDTGFIVHNDRAYPILTRLFAELGVRRYATEMSMSIVDAESGVSYVGGRGLGGVFAQPHRSVDPRFLSMLLEIKRFHICARRELAAGHAGSEVAGRSLARFLDELDFSARFRRQFMIPLVSCVWSSGGDRALDYPARYLFEFLDNHGMLSVGGSPQWYTVEGGSGRYVGLIAAKIDTIRTSTPVRSIVRAHDHVDVVDASGHTDTFDRVVVATHPDQALAMLADATPRERDVLSSIEYSDNEVVLHTDSSLLPRSRRARGAWNLEVGTEGAPRVTYWMNRLQGLRGTRDYLVSLNSADRVDPSTVIAQMNYSHPLYSTRSVAAQRQLDSLATDRFVLAGAYHGWGFHEDGARSGVAAATRFGAQW